MVPACLQYNSLTEENRRHGDTTIVESKMLNKKTKDCKNSSRTIHIPCLDMVSVTWIIWTVVFNVIPEGGLVLLGEVDTGDC